MNYLPAFLILSVLTASPLRAQVAATVVQEKFRAFDTNSDGVISGTELESATYLRKLDLDGNGSLTLEESIRALRGKATTTPAADGPLFRQLDKNKDGVLTAGELPRKQWFDRLDTDGDGRVTESEAGAVVAAMRKRGETIPRLPAETGVKPASEDPALTEMPVVLRGAEFGVGRLMPDLNLKDAAGLDQKLSARMAGREGVLMAFFGATCPISGKLGPELARLEKTCAEQKVQVLLVCPVAAETADEMQEFVTAHGLQSPVIHDRDQTITTTLAATTSTEVFLLDAKRTLVYRGAINDQYGLGYAKDKPTKTYLRDALTAMLRHTQPVIAATTAPGCALDLPTERDAAGKAQTAVTYHHQIERILQANCVECHREGGVGPFALTRYEDVIEHAGMIRKQVDRGVMPPWFAAPPADGEHSQWLNDRSLSKQDKADLIAWLGGDRAKGDLADAPVALTFPDEWTIGEPDAVVPLPKAIAIKAEGTMPYQFVTATTDFKEDRWVQGYEIIPTDRSVVHHVIVQVHPKGAKLRDRDEGTEGYWAAYVPGNSAHVWPEGFAKKLPAGATVSFQIHYTPNGKATSDQLKMGLVFAKEEPRYIVHTAAVPNPRLNIPPGAANHVEVAERTIPTDMNVTAYMAHMHVRGKAFKFEITAPDGRQETLLDIPRYDFNWQLRYDCAQPKFLPRGTKVKITAVYDNSDGNPANPDAAKNVRWGQQTFDEMMIGYFEYYTPNKKDVAAR